MTVEDTSHDLNQINYLLWKIVLFWFLEIKNWYFHIYLILIVLSFPFSLLSKCEKLNMRNRREREYPPQNWIKLESTDWVYNWYWSSKAYTSLRTVGQLDSKTFPFLSFLCHFLNLSSGIHSNLPKVL